VKNCIIVGGGICGIFSSIVLADRFENVYLVESQECCGGLLRSIQDENGVIYDQGTHIPSSTLVTEIDDILFGSEQEKYEDWHVLGKLKTGNFFSGEWDFNTQIVDTRKLAVRDYEKGIVELLTLTQKSNASFILPYLKETIGPTFTDKIAIPLLKKLYGGKTNLNELITRSSINYFGLSRVIGLSADVTKKLKEMPVFDEKLGFHNAQEYQDKMAENNVQECAYYYPKGDKGVQLWIEKLIHKAKKKGVTFLTNESISKITHSNNHITSVTLKNANKVLECDLLYWGAAPVMAMHAAELKVDSARPNLRTANIFHFTFDKPILNTSSHYLWNWDVTHKSFRVTLYPNLKNDDACSHTHSLTIEALTGPDDSDIVNAEMMLDELKSMRLISEDSRVVSSLRQTLHNTFPVPTQEFNLTCENNFNFLNNSFDNIMISGRFSGKLWLQSDILKSAYDSITTEYPLFR